MAAVVDLLQDPALLAAIAQATDDAIFAKDAQGRYQYANRAALALVGKTLDEVIGRSDLEILGPTDTARSIAEADWHVLTTGETIERQETFRAPDGSARHWASRKMPLRDRHGRIVGLVGISRDVTTRRESELHAEADRLKLQMAIQAAGLVTAEIDYRNNENHISSELARMMELGDGPMIVPRQAIFDRIHPDDRQRYLDAIARTVDPKGSGHLAIDVRALMPSGAMKWLHIVLQVTFSMIDGQMRPDRGICAAADVTDKIVADRRKDEFIATLAHELRNPLAPIRNGLEIFKRTPDLPASAVKVRDMMDRQLSHLVRLVDDLLDVSRITRDKLEMRMHPVTLRAIVEDAVDASHPGITAAHHELRVEMPEPTVRLEGDLTRLAQVVSNLLNNAAKYTPPGGRIDLRARMESSRTVVIEVSDNGAGIAPDVLPRVFDLFSQGDGTRERSQGGLGIGLWLVKKLVELHHGTIEASSEGPGRGSTFLVRLPARAQP